MYRSVSVGLAASVSLLIFCVQARAASLGDAPTSRVDAAVATALRYYDIPGATVAVLDGGKVIYARAFGFSNLAKHDRASTGTHYEIGSITKQFTAAAIV